jgi:hypothetical protein
MQRLHIVSVCMITTDEAIMRFTCNFERGRNHYPAAHTVRINAMGGYRRGLNL